jgi:(E)-4-hydroxy-3-methylbut-2-enyl-diphosphate synthase
MSEWSYNGLVYCRRPTRTVHVGDVAIGSDHPIRIQSMTTAPPRDTAATVGEIVALAEAGCEIVRVAVPTTKDAESLAEIRRELSRLDVRIPLVADIHFTPAAAMKAVEHVDKIRINPGNYADKKKFALQSYTDDEYSSELTRIEKAFTPLVLRAKELGVSMRIGANHGSLSDRIMNRYGDTSEGMVESALEFVRICESHGYRDLILSMKASNPVVVVQVYRLLAQRMAGEMMDYPLHLGVTEAGGGDDGRIKSAIGIGALLEEGLGDTIRVSLTEDPVAEIPVARALAAACGGAQGLRGAKEVRERRDPFVYRRRETAEVHFGPAAAGGSRRILVESDLRSSLADEEALRAEVESLCGAGRPEGIRAELLSVAPESPGQVTQLENLRRIICGIAPTVALSARVELGWFGPAARENADISRWLSAVDRLQLVLREPPAGAAGETFGALLSAAAASDRAVLIEAAQDVEVAVEAARRARRHGGRLPMLALTPDRARTPLLDVRLLAARLDAEGLAAPLLLLDNPEARGRDPLLAPAATLGGLLCDGIGDAIRITGSSSVQNLKLSYDILQAARVRLTRTDFISCPSCGRTLFDLQETTARIQARTSHLKGLKIAIMGCIVNGPGEMADADFGYVGWGEDKIALFVGKEMVAKDIPTDEAADRLVALIKEHGRWVEPTR